MAPLMRRQGGSDGEVATVRVAHLLWVSLGAAVLLALAHPTGTTADTSGAAGPPDASPTLQLQVDPGGGYALDGLRASDIVVERALRAARRQSPDLRLRIDAAGDDPGRLIAALALAEHAGIHNVGSRMH